MCAVKRNALGKGLTALLSDSKTDITGTEEAPVNSIAEIPINKIEANPFQPRENFDDENMADLVASIKVHGIIQPITVRKIGYDKFQVISGERRTRAAIRAGLKEIPAFVRVANDQNMLELALIENTHRENLNPVEIALSYKRLVEECKLTQDLLAERVGKNRTTVTNYLRLLKLPEQIQIGLCEELLTMGHARAIINIEDREAQLKIYNEIINNHLSVRKVEDLVKKSKSPKKKTVDKPEKDDQENENSDILDVYQHKFSRVLDSNIKIKHKKGWKGEIIIPYYSEEDLKRISDFFDK